MGSHSTAGLFMAILFVITVSGWPTTEKQDPLLTDIVRKFQELTVQLHSHEQQLIKAQEKTRQLEKSFTIGSRFMDELLESMLDAWQKMSLYDHQLSADLKMLAMQVHNASLDIKANRQIAENNSVALSNTTYELSKQKLIEKKLVNLTDHFTQSKTGLEHEMRETIAALKVLKDDLAERKKIVNERMRSERRHTLEYRLEYSCRDAATLQNVWDMPGTHHAPPDGHLIYLDKHNIKCNRHEYISQLRLVRQGNLHARYEYLCCTTKLVTL